MKRLTLTVRLVLLNTCLSTLIMGFVLGLLFSISSREIQLNVEHQLEQRVNTAENYIHYRQNRLEFDSDLLETEYGIYLSIYNSQTNELLYGKVPYGFVYDLAFNTDELRTITSQDVHYLVLDEELNLGGNQTLMIRGIVSITAAQADFQRSLHLAMILFPFLVGLTALVGYFISRRALMPVARITQTVHSIQEDQDLSRRINLGEGKDEIYHLAHTFDALLETIEAGVKREQQFTSDVAHELRTPLSVMQMQCEELSRQPELNIESRKQIALLQQKIASMSEMVNQLLLFSRIDQQRTALNKEEVNLSDLLDFCVEEMREIAVSKQIVIMDEIEEDITFFADETLIIRMIVNLIQNAIEYGKEGGHVWVRLLKTQDNLCLEVQDDGIGISQKDIPHIFERFYRADASRHANHSGLGLAMVQWIVDVHDGKIEVSSQIDEGSTFRCIFPQQKVENDRR